MPGSLRLWTYSALPVTLSHDSRRGTERPTCGVSVACVARFIDRPFEVNAEQLLLIRGRSVQIALDVQALRSLDRSKARRLVGRRADEDVGLVPVEHHRHAKGRPVV